MKSLTKITINTLGVALISLSAVPASADMIVLDDFNRTAGATLGAEWTQRDGQCAILAGASANTADCHGSTNSTYTGLATYNGYTSDAIGLDVFHNERGTGVDYAALVLGYNTNYHNLFVKIQDGNNRPGFDSLYFYYGNNTTGTLWTGGGKSFYSNAFGTGVDLTQAYFEASLVGDILNVTVKDLLTNQEWSFSRGNVPLANLGTGIGVGGFNVVGATQQATFDNFRAFSAVPEPASLALLGIGLAGLAAARRRRKG